jgi:hypothetical protein
MYLITTKTKAVLNDTNAWCNWRYDVAFRELVAMPRSSLSQQLLDDILRRHGSKNTLPGNATTPFISFVQTIAKEEQILTRYQWMVNHTRLLHVQRLLPGPDLTPYVQQRLDRLAFIQSVFFERTQESHRYRHTENSSDKKREIFIATSYLEPLRSLLVRLAAGAHTLLSSLKHWGTPSFCCRSTTNTQL